MRFFSSQLFLHFEYSIDIDSTIDPEITLIPPMLLQPIIENSIWHGLSPKGEGGKIFIRIKKQEETILCEVEDNGIGRKFSQTINKETKPESYGLKITAERLALIEQVKKIKTQLTFQDLNENEHSSGLKITFALPFEANS